MNPKVKSALESYARSFAVAALTAYSMGARDIQDLVIAGLIAILGPAIRAVNPKDPAFGMIADTVTVELDKMAKAEKKKRVKKK
jgi:hypothetical protein